MAIIPIAVLLENQLKAAGIPIVGVGIGIASDTSTWHVQPSSLQSEAQPIIDAVNITAYGLEWEWSELRRIRNLKLTDCDWTQLTDAPLDAATVDAWRTYRQALRDVPQDTADPTTVVWPDEPTP